MKQYNIYLADKNTHKIVAQLIVSCDGYLTALAEATKLSKEHTNTYVARVFQ